MYVPVLIPKEIGCAILLSAMLESLIVSACVVEVCGTLVSATSDLHNSVVTCFDSTLLLLSQKYMDNVNQSVG